MFDTVEIASRMRTFIYLEYVLVILMHSRKISRLVRLD